MRVLCCAKYSLQTCFNQQSSDFYRRRDRENSRGRRPRSSISHFPPSRSLALTFTRSPAQILFFLPDEHAGPVSSFAEVKPERLCFTQRKPATPSYVRLCQGERTAISVDKRRTMQLPIHAAAVFATSSIIIDRLIDPPSTDPFLLSVECA